VYSTFRGWRCRRQWKSILDGGYSGASSHISLDMNLRLRSTCRSSPFGFSFLVSFVLLPATSTGVRRQHLPASPHPSSFPFPFPSSPFASFPCARSLSLSLSLSLPSFLSLGPFIFSLSLHFARKVSSRVSQIFVGSAGVRRRSFCNHFARKPRRSAVSAGVSMRLDTTT